MTDEKNLHAELNGLLRRLRTLEQESEAKRKKYYDKGADYLEGVYSGESSGLHFAAEMLETLLVCNSIIGKEAEHGKAGV